jgi:hypothetical protein
MNVFKRVYAAFIVIAWILLGILYFANYGLSLTWALVIGFAIAFGGEMAAAIVRGLKAARNSDTGA